MSLPILVAIVVVASLAIAYFVAARLSRAKPTGASKGSQQPSAPVPTVESQRRETEKQWKRAQVETGARKDREPR